MNWSNWRLMDTTSANQHQLDSDQNPFAPWRAPWRTLKCSGGLSRARQSMPSAASWKRSTTAVWRSSTSTLQLAPGRWDWLNSVESLPDSYVRSTTPRFSKQFPLPVNILAPKACFIPNGSSLTVAINGVTQNIRTSNLNQTAGQTLSLLKYNT